VHLTITIRLHDPRYHGVPEWPPSPARVFQALVAGVARRNEFASPVEAALLWLEALPPPLIVAPRQHRGQRVVAFVPNNDADAFGGDLSRLPEIRAKKMMEPRLLIGDPAFVYAWPVAAADAVTQSFDVIAGSLYQFGRGVDMAWAVADVLDDADLDAVVDGHQGVVHRPARGGSVELACPVSGRLSSLRRRYAEMSKRLRRAPDARADEQLFVQPSKATYAYVAYDSVPERRVYELRRDDELHPAPLRRIVALVEAIRDAAAGRIRAVLPGRTDDIDSALIGRQPGDVGTPAAAAGRRIHIIPLPSIGHDHADRSVRRVVIETPSSALLSRGDVDWTFSGLTPNDPETGEVLPFVLTPTEEAGMLDHFTGPSRTWRSVTPAALPEAARRRRIDPARRVVEAKPAAERVAEEDRACGAIATALRHAGVRGRVLRVRVQREPFEAKGTRAEAFASGTRFAKERLWHVELELDGAVDGPLVIGDGRFLGLGLMAPWQQAPLTDVMAFATHGTGGAPPDHEEMARALRRAVMSRVQRVLGPHERMPAFFSGHEHDGPARSDGSPHLAFCFAAPHLLLVVPPHVLQRRSKRLAEERHIAELRHALEGFVELRAGRAGRFELDVASLSEDHELFAVSRRWASLTPYRLNRHGHKLSAAEAVRRDVATECRMRDLPSCDIEVKEIASRPGSGVDAWVVVTFATAVRGPIILGKSRYSGGGLFRAS
jgi:CRISPR-associated protein Csb2